MQITIRSVLGVERADLSVSPLALVAGLNGAAKSSTLTAIACALTGQTMPGGIAKKDGKIIVRDGADIGRVTVKGDDGQVSVAWPKADATTDGRAPHASPTAAGLTSPIDMEMKDRAKILAKFLKLDPTKADLARALRDSDGRFVSTGFATEKEAEGMRAIGLDWKENRDTAIYRAIERFWPEVEVSGFDGAHQKAGQFGTELKGSWRTTTGENYGVAKAPQWQHKDAALVDDIVPAGKDPLGYLTMEVEERKKALELTIRLAGVAANEVDQLRAKVASIPNLEAVEKETKANQAALSDAYQAWTRKAPPTVPSAPIVCPHCSGAVSIEAGKLVEVSNAPDPEAISTAQAALDQFNAGKQADKEAFEAAYDDHKKAELELVEARSAKNKLDALGDHTPTTEADVEKAKVYVAKAEKALVAVKQKAEADKLHRQFVANQAMVDALSPEGVRKVKLAKVLEAFNETRLLPLSNAAGWKAVTIGPDLEIRYDGRLAQEPHSSESQVMRAKIVLQVALAQIDGSACVLIDRADKLDPKGRNGLFGLLKAAGIPAIVAMTYGKKDLTDRKVPNLASANLGETYWIEAGITTPLADAMPAPVRQAAAE